MTMNVWLRDDPKTKARLDCGAHETAGEMFVDDLLEKEHWGKKEPDHVFVIARLSRDKRHYSVRVDIVDCPGHAYVGGLARRCDRDGVEL